jgi:hypothetical protein
MATKYHINPRFRAYGKARIDVTRRAKNEQEWQNQWRDPMYDFPFAPGAGWQFCFEYKVDDFAAEVGFFIDVLGFPVRAFSPSYAQFSSPGGEICFSVLSTGEGEESTPPDSIRLHLNVRNIQQAAKELISRGIVYEKITATNQAGTSVQTGYFRSPHGVCIEIWSEAGSGTLWDEEEEDDEFAEFNEENLHDEETDLLIDKLLGLSGGRSQLEDEDIDIGEGENSGEQDVEEEVESAILDVDEGIDHSNEDIQLKEEQQRINTRTKSSSVAWGADRQARLPKQGRRHPADLSRRTSLSSWPANNDQKDAELIYQQIDEELPEDEI